MPPIDPAAPDPKQPSCDALTTLLASSTAAYNNTDNTPDARSAAWDTRKATSHQLEVLDLAVFTGNTAQLEAAKAAMTPGMDQLKDLQQKISALGNDFKEAATVLTDIDKVVGAVSALF
jgi:hypothetical protein